MKSIFRIVLAALALILPTVSLAATLGDCCCWDPCKGGPLCCGKFSVMVKGGVTPSGYTHRGAVWLTVPNATPPVDPAVFSVSVTSKFKNQFNLPWNVGAELAWNASCRIQFFLEYAHTLGSKKNTAFTAGLFDVFEQFSDYEVNAGYLGGRYFFEGCCFSCIGRITPYVGFKSGFAVQKQVSYGLSLGGNFIATNPYFLSQTVPSVGLQVGLEWWFSKCLSAVLQGEFVGTCGLRSNRNVVFDPSTTGGLTNVNIGRTGWVLAWPVTLGVRYTF